MFCPKCRSEYEPGIATCSDCGIPLVGSIPEPERYKFVEILSTFNLADIAFIKSLLADNDIQYFFLDENFSALEPVQPARLVVREDHAENAEELLKDVNLNYMAYAPGTDEEEDNE